ncbi:MAG: hypothetical protein HW403_534 [Dehalococcoidia bacterium]|nr:hypothetical protein [Dehalococcoidia bacterium]
MRSKLKVAVLLLAALLLFSILQNAWVLFRDGNVALPGGKLVVSLPTPTPVLTPSLVENLLLARLGPFGRRGEELVTVRASYNPDGTWHVRVIGIVGNNYVSYPEWLFWADDWRWIPYNLSAVMVEQALVTLELRR